MATRRARIGDVDVAYETFGSGEPVILAHAATLARDVWERNTGALAERFSVTALDWPGHGETVGDTLDVVAFGEALCDALGIGSAHWIGASWGGGVAIRMAARTSRVRRLVLVGTSGVPPRIVSQHSRPRPKGESAWQLFRATYEDSGYATRERFERVTALQKRAMPYLTRFIAAQGSDYAGRGLLADMERIAAPTLIVWGEHDRIYPVGIAPVVQQAIRGSKLSVYGRSNHFPFVDEAERFNREVLEFLSAT